MGSRKVTRIEWWCSFRTCDERVDSTDEALPDRWVAFGAETFCGEAHLIRYVLDLRAAIGNGSDSPSERSVGRILPPYLERPLLVALLEAPRGVTQGARDARIIALAREQYTKWMTQGQSDDD